MMSPVANHPHVQHRSMHEPVEPVVETRYVYVDRPAEPVKAPSMAAQLGFGLLGMVLRWFLIAGLIVVLFVGAVVGGLWLLGKGVERLPDVPTGVTTTTLG